MLHFVPPGFVGLLDMWEAVVARLFGREWVGSIDVYKDTITGEISVVDGLPGPDENKFYELAKRFDMAQKHVLQALSDGALTAEVDVGGARLTAPAALWKMGAGWRTLQTGIIPEDLSADTSLGQVAGRPCFTPREQFDRWLATLTPGLEVEPLDSEQGQLGRKKQREQETRAMYKRWYDRSQEIKVDNKARRPIEIARLIAKEERKAGYTKANAETIKRQLNQYHRGWAD